MAVTYIGSATGVNSVTMPTHQVGDLILCLQYDSTATLPTAPSGFSTLSTGTSSGIYHRLSYKIAATTSETIGTPTNTTNVVVGVWRTPLAPNVVDVSTGSSAGTSVFYPASTKDPAYFVAFGITLATDSAIETPPTGMVSRTSVLGAAVEIALHDTNGEVSGGWPAASVSVGGTSASTRAFVVGLVDRRVIAANAGAYSITGWPANKIQRVGSAFGATGATMPAHQAGDLILYFAFNRAAAVAPSTPTGFTSSGSSTGNGTGYNIGSLVALSSSTTISGLTNCTALGVVIYRNARLVLPASNSSLASSTSVTYLAKSGDLWFVGISATQAIDSAIETPPAGMINVGDYLDANNELVIHDTGGIIPGGWPNTAVSIAGTAATWRSTIFGLSEIVSYTLTADPGSLAITGADASLLAGRALPAAAGALALTGQDAGLLRGRIMAADGGGLALAGIDAGMLYGRKLQADPGVVTLTGADAALLAGRILAASGGAILLTGADVTFYKGRTLSAGSGSYGLTGADAGLLAARILGATAGDYAVGGQAAGLFRGFTLVAGAGGLALSGQDAGLLAGRKIAANAGALALTGLDAGLLFGRRLSAGAGGYTLDGQPALLLRGYVLSAAAGGYALSGADVEFEYAKALIVMRWNGADWEPRRLYRWDGAIWRPVTGVKIWDGLTWNALEQ